MFVRDPVANASGTLGYATSTVTPDARAFEIAIDEIDVPADARAVNSDHVALLAKSIEVNGLQPGGLIVVQWAPAGHAKRAVLVAGRHRLEAFRLLGCSVVPCFIFNGSPEEAALWRNCENAVHLELPPLQRARAIAALVEAAERGRNAQVSVGGRGNKGGVSAVARALGISRASPA
jgi:ParB family chromosome partitioning protein